MKGAFPDVWVWPTKLSSSPPSSGGRNIYTVKELLVQKMNP